MRLQLKHQIEQIDDEQDNTGCAADFQDGTVCQLAAGVIE
jgi:hypothetical protein